MYLTKYTLKPLRKFVLFGVVLSFYQHILWCQNNENQKVVENIYDLIENNKSAQEIFGLTSKIKWDSTKIENRYTITIFSILKNEWRGVSFQNIVFRELEQNKVLVSGTITGRQPSECEAITTDFNHIWTLKDGKIINLIE